MTIVKGANPAFEEEDVQARTTRTTRTKLKNKSLSRISQVSILVFVFEAAGRAAKAGVMVKERFLKLRSIAR
jgi:hypothetical protein